MEEAILYVKSEKFDLVSWASDLHCGCDAAYRSIRTDRIFSEKDREAIKILGESSMPHSVIDLTDCPLTFRIKAKFEGINETPTLIAGSTKIKGLHEIMKYVSKLE